MGKGFSISQVLAPRTCIWNKWQREMGRLRFNHSGFGASKKVWLQDSDAIAWWFLLQGDWPTSYVGHSILPSVLVFPVWSFSCSHFYEHLTAPQCRLFLPEVPRGSFCGWKSQSLFDAHVFLFMYCGEQRWCWKGEGGRGGGGRGGREDDKSIMKIQTNRKVMK